MPVLQAMGMAGLVKLKDNPLKGTSYGWMKLSCEVPLTFPAGPG